MRIAVTGSSGLIGSALCASLEGDGHDVVRVVRSGGRPGTVRWDIDAGTVDATGLEGLDGVVHLAGEGIASGRFSEDHKRAVLESRTKGTALLSRTLAELDARPPVLLSGSAIGYYGDRGDEELVETSPPGEGFLPEVCVAWERETSAAEAAGVRVAHLRTGVVLSADGGALGKQLLPFKLGLGGKAGKGDQWLPWISLEDHVRAMRFLLTADVQGPVNLTAPNPVRNVEFVRTLGAVLGRPTVIPIPGFARKLPLGVGPLVDNLLFSSSRVLPQVLTDAGFTWHHDQLEDALRSLLDRPAA
ncbi:TIGR01777 family protein [Iamia sp. SCSIO 61187]|uniref:TIGR01777 family oxidoreductase n=1 Tax=Iamia sp. SCSIO 61187 TaxID=2722752 RepID=UPI001C63A156|nr:TIGR01777 family oxidoreductase [Iamia sp. SCSIO 61187]QYG92338.1 TIGR01777 family protein [Iamia sp. SCSIO 61187]